MNMAAPNGTPPGRVAMLCRRHALDTSPALENEPYCVVKPSVDLPAYAPGSDADMFCYDPGAVARILMAQAAPWIEDGDEVRVTELHGGAQIHLDFLRAGAVEFRFDLYGELPHYEHLRIRPALFESVTEGRVWREAPGCRIPVPHETDDLLLRYLEYQEWYARRPDKVRHAEYIRQAVEDGASAKDFLDKLHRYTALPDVHGPHRTAGHGPLRAARELVARARAKTPRELALAVGRRLLWPLRRAAALVRRGGR